VRRGDGRPPGTTSRRHEVDLAVRSPPLENLEPPRGRPARTPCTGPTSAGILMQMPDELPGARSVDFDPAAAPAATTGVPDVLSCRQTQAARGRLEEAARADGAQRGARSRARLARGADRRDADGRGRRRLPALRSAQLFVGRRLRPSRTTATPLSASCTLIRKDCASSPAEEPGLLRLVELFAHDQLQGHADQLPAGGVSNAEFCATRRTKSAPWRWCTRASRTKHVPPAGELRPHPLPGHLPQRRDQTR